MSKIELTSAYQGKGWKPRRSFKTGAWADLRVNSEYAPLEAVLLYKPSRTEIKKIREPRKVQHLHPIAIPQLEREYKALKSAYKKLGVKVFELEPGLLPEGLRQAPPNLMFVRDLFFNSPRGAIVARMASEVRAGEEKFASAKLAALGLPILASVQDAGVFEGADCLWLNPGTVLCGTGARTNRNAFEQIAAQLGPQDVKLVEVQMPEGIQHLLGMLQLVDRDLAVVRTDIAPASLISLLRKHKFKIVPVPENKEVREKLGMNFVTVRPREILMAGDCPGLRTLLEANGLRVAAQVGISQLRNAAGGIGCATGILARKLVR